MTDRRCRARRVRRPRRRRLARVLAISVVIGLGVAGPAGPAAAHTRTAETTNVVSRLVGAPVPAGIEIVVHTGGLLVEMINHTDAEVVVSGYEGEPYLRIGPRGVYENVRSPATHLNRARFADVALPPSVDPAATPDWRFVRAEPRAAWHDHRTHWMSPVPPRFVEASELARIAMRTELVGPIGRAGAPETVFASWAIPMTHGEVAIEITGELAWADPPSHLPWLTAAALAVAVGLMVAVRSRGGDLVGGAAIVVGAVAALAGIGLVDDLAAWPSAPLDELFGLLHTTFFLAGGLAGAAWAAWAPTGRVLGLGVGSGSILYHQGILHLPLLFASQFPTVWPVWLVRLSVALALVQGVVAAGVAIRVARARSQAGSTFNVKFGTNSIRGA